MFLSSKIPRRELKLTMDKCDKTHLEIRCILYSYPAPLSNAAYFWAICCALLSYITPYWPSVHFDLCCALWATLRPSELRCILTSYTTPYWATLHPAELRCTLLSYHPDTLHHAELHAAPFWTKLHLLSNASPYGATGTLLSYAAPCRVTH